RGRSAGRARGTSVDAAGATSSVLSTAMAAGTGTSGNGVSSCETAGLAAGDVRCDIVQNAPAPVPATATDTSVILAQPMPSAARVALVATRPASCWPRAARTAAGGDL